MEEKLNTAGGFEAEFCYEDRQCILQVLLLWKILKININSVSEENLLRQFEAIFVGVGKLNTFRPNSMLMNQSNQLLKS